MSLPWESVATGGKRIAAPVCGLARNDNSTVSFELNYSSTTITFTVPMIS